MLAARELTVPLITESVVSSQRTCANNSVHFRSFLFLRTCRLIKWSSFCAQHFKKTMNFGLSWKEKRLLFYLNNEAHFQLNIKRLLKRDLCVLYGTFSSAQRLRQDELRVVLQ